MDVVIGNSQATGPLRVPEDVLAMHTLITGASGYGKSTLAYVLIREQLKRGASLVAVDPSLQTVRILRGLCHEVGMPAERVVTVDPSDPRGAPGLNPFRSGSGPGEAAASVMGIFRKTNAFDGAVRVEAFVQAASYVAAWHGLPFTGIMDLIRDEAYRNEVLASRPVHRPTESYREEVDYLRTDFSDMKPGDRQETARSMRLRFKSLLGSDLFLRMFGSEENGVDFDSLFSRKAAPGAVLVCTARMGGLTEAAGQILAGIVFDLLFSAANRNQGGRPVVLAVDEMKKFGVLLESGISDLVNMSRKANVRLILAGQHVGQLPDGIRADVLASSALKAYFNPGEDPTNAAASALAKAARRWVEPAPEPEIEPARLRLYGYNGHRKRDGLIPIVPDPPMPSGHYVDPNADLRPIIVDPADPDRSLGRFMRAAREYLPYVATEDANDIRSLLRATPRGCARLIWRDRSAWLYIEAPPKRQMPPVQRTDRTEYWAGPLGSLGKGEAFVTVGTGSPTKVRVTWHDPPADAPMRYVMDAGLANAASPPRLRVPPTPPASPPAPPVAKTAPAPPPPAKADPPKTDPPKAVKAVKNVVPAPITTPKPPTPQEEDEDDGSIDISQW